jgi:hypothetical protein
MPVQSGTTGLGPRLAAKGVFYQSRAVQNPDSVRPARLAGTPDCADRTSLAAGFLITSAPLHPQFEITPHVQTVDKIRRPDCQTRRPAPFGRQ